MSIEYKPDDSNIILSIRNESSEAGKIIEPLPYAVKPRIPVPYWNYSPRFSGEINGVNFVSFSLYVYQDNKVLLHYDFFTLDPKKDKSLKLIDCPPLSSVELKISTKDLFQTIWSGPTYRFSDSFKAGANKYSMSGTMSFFNPQGKKLYELNSPQCRFQAELF